ncbi:MAG: permease-like cell division protein FtsX [Eubacterium sp.]|nr:permease-like cell division protein FtsX [Eubacterium sp.]
MNEKDIAHMKESLTLPREMKNTLLRNSTQPRKSHYRYTRYSRICAILTAVICIGAFGSTSIAAYNIYQEKQLAVFMEHDLTQEEIAALADELALIPDITYQYVSADEAWSYFKKAYLEGNSELSLSFTENPLADSFNYQISIRIGADTQEVREQISHLEGVRKVTTIREWKKTTKASALY